MTVIFSGVKIEGLRGRYCVPNLVTQADLVGVTLVYTDNKRVIDMANELNIEVRDFPKHPPASAEKEDKKEEPKIQESSEPLVDIFQPIDMGNATISIGHSESTEPAVVKETTLEEDILADVLTKEQILAKHNISPQKLGAMKRKLKVE